MSTESIYSAGTAGTSTDKSRRHRDGSIHDQIKHRACEIATEILGRAPDKVEKSEAKWFKRLRLAIDGPRAGLWWRRKDEVGGNLYQLIRDELRLDHAGIVAWLTERGYLPEAPGAEHARAWKTNGHANGHANGSNGHDQARASNGHAGESIEAQGSEENIDLDVSKLVPIEGTPGEVYYNGRGITDIPESSGGWVCRSVRSPARWSHRCAIPTPE